MFNGLFRKVRGNKTGSGEIAKQRLKFALIYDKLEISDDTLRNLHRDMVEVISRYFEIDQAAFRLDIHRSDDFSSLVVNTPILSAKRGSPD
ncbi:cell division topological specificity factor MinE [Desulfococcaceae bacterium HSG8]|nr:cell division topological specificity factor MinE [Desulfococcaceae bacterium HSG8]